MWLLLTFLFVSSSQKKSKNSNSQPAASEALRLLQKQKQVLQLDIPVNDKPAVCGNNREEIALREIFKCQQPTTIDDADTNPCTRIQSFVTSPQRQMSPRKDETSEIRAVYATLGTDQVSPTLSTMEPMNERLVWDGLRNLLLDEAMVLGEHTGSAFDPFGGIDPEGKVLEEPSVSLSVMTPEDGNEVRTV